MRYLLPGLALFALLTSGCVRGLLPQTRTPAEPTPPATSPAPAATDAGKPAPAPAPAPGLRVEAKDGTVVLLIAGGEGTRTVSAGGKEIGDVSVAEGVLKASVTGKPFYKVARDGDNLRLDRYNGFGRIARLEARDGGWRLKDGKDAMLLKIKPDGGDFKLGDDAGTKIGKLSVTPSKMMVKDASGAVLYTVTGDLRTSAVGILRVPGLSRLDQAALIVAAKLL